VLSKELCIFGKLLFEFNEEVVLEQLMVKRFAVIQEETK